MTYLTIALILLCTPIIIILCANIMKDRRSSFEESPISYAGCWYAQLKHIHTGETKSGVIPPKWVYNTIEECKLNP